jgi:hypothetical protein
MLLGVAQHQLEGVRRDDRVVADERQVRVAALLDGGHHLLGPDAVGYLPFGVAAYQHLVDAERVKGSENLGYLPHVEDR